jgi:hypothetical protein
MIENIPRDMIQSVYLAMVSRYDRYGGRTGIGRHGKAYVVSSAFRLFFLRESIITSATDVKCAIHRQTIAASVIHTALPQVRVISLSVSFCNLRRTAATKTRSMIRTIMVTTPARKPRTNPIMKSVPFFSRLNVYNEITRVIKVRMQATG